jgi:hypothetical protein
MFRQGHSYEKEIAESSGNGCSKKSHHEARKGRSWFPAAKKKEKELLLKVQSSG